MPSSAQSLGSWTTTDQKKNHLLITNPVHARSQTGRGAGGCRTPPVAIGAQEDGVSTESRPHQMEDERADGGIMGWVAHNLRFNFFQLWVRIWSSSSSTRVSISGHFPDLHVIIGLGNWQIIRTEKGAIHISIHCCWYLSGVSSSIVFAGCERMLQFHGIPSVVLTP